MNQSNVKRQAPIQLHRSAKNRMIAGVCGGLAETLGVDPMVVRLVALVLLIPFTVFTVLVYAIFGLLLPVEE